MRTPRATCPLGVFAIALSFVTLSFATNAASEEEKFTRLFVFGDSYTDINLASFWRVYPLPLQQDLGIPQIVPFGVGGARASPFGPPAVVPPGFHLQQQVDFYLTTNNPIGPRDLVTLNIGGNDGLGILAGLGGFIGYPAFPMTAANAPTFADITAGYTTTQIQRLVNAGARTFVLGEFSGLSGLLSIPRGDPTADAYGRAYFNDMQVRLEPLAQSGVRFFMLDLFRLGNAVFDDPSKYGFSAFQCPLPSPPSIICGGSITSPAQTQFYLGPDHLHLTSGGFALVAHYMSNIVLAPDTIATQPDVVRSTAAAFTGTVLSRLDANREQQIAAQFGSATSAPDGLMGLGYGDELRARRIAPAQSTDPTSRVTAYTLGSLAGGHRSDSPDLIGFDYDADAATVGIEYRVNRQLVVGVAGNFASTHADLQNSASVNIDATQVAAYLSYSSRHWFGDALVGYGHHSLDLARPGVVDWVHSSSDANSFTAATRGGYLFDWGSLRAGPIAGLTYVHSGVGAYTEQGDPLLTYNVSGQSFDALTGNAGLQFRTPFRAGGNIISPFLNVTVEHQFGDTTRTLTATLTQAPILPILSPEPNFDARTYGKIEGGVTLQITRNVSTTLNASSTFARADGNDFLISGGLNYRF